MDLDKPLGELPWHIVNRGAYIASLLYGHFGSDATVVSVYNAFRTHARQGTIIDVPGLTQEYYLRLREVFGADGVALPSCIGAAHGRPLIGMLETGYGIERIVLDGKRNRLSVSLAPGTYEPECVKEDFRDALDPFARRFGVSYELTMRGNELRIIMKPGQAPGNAGAFVTACARMLERQERR